MNNTMSTVLLLLCTSVTFADSYKMAGMALPPYPGNMYVSVDQGRTWQPYGKIAKANYAFTLSADGTLWHRTGNDEIAGCETDGSIDCSQPNKGARCRELVADNFGYLYHLDPDTQRIWISENNDNGHSGTWQQFARLGKGIKKIIASVTTPKELFVLKNDAIIMIRDGKIEGSTPTPQPLAGIIQTPNHTLWGFSKNFLGYVTDERWIIYDERWNTVEAPGEISDFAVAPDNTLFLVTQKNCFKGSSAALCYQLWNSKDNGATWNNVADNVPFQRITIQPQHLVVRHCHRKQVKFPVVRNPIRGACGSGYKEMSGARAATVNLANPFKDTPHLPVNGASIYCCSTREDITLEEGDFEVILEAD